MKSEFELFDIFWFILQFYYSSMCLPYNQSVRLKEFSKIYLHTTLSEKYYFIVLTGITVLDRDGASFGLRYNQSKSEKYRRIEYQTVLLVHEGRVALEVRFSIYFTKFKVVHFELCALLTL